MVIFGTELNVHGLIKAVEELDQMGVPSGYLDLDPILDIHTLEFEYDEITWRIEQTMMGGCVLRAGRTVVKTFWLEEEAPDYLKRRSEFLRERHEKVYRRYLAEVFLKFGN